MNADDTLYGRIKNRVLTISGNSPSIRVDGGCLVVSDGPMPVPANHCGAAPPANERMAVLRLPRAGCPVDRIVVARPDGFVTFGAIRWLHGVGCALVQLDWYGTVLLATAPAGPDRPAIRRAQALAAGDKNGLAIMREILRCKLAGQATLARILGGKDAAAEIDRLSGEIDHAFDGTRVLAVEGTAAAMYWALWRDLPLHFARRDKVPEHWRKFGLRRPEGSKQARNAKTIGGALVNYLYGVLASEMTIALLGAGLDPGIGVFHADRENRASLAYDALEALRPFTEAWLLSCIAQCRFSQRDFYEENDGTIRITRPLTSYLAMTAPLWRHSAEMVAGWVAESFAGFARRSGERSRDDEAIAAAPIGALMVQRTGNPNSEGSQLSPSDMVQLPKPLPDPLLNLPSPGRAYRSAFTHDLIPRGCYECGQALGPRQRKFCSHFCSDTYRAELQRVLPIGAAGALSAEIRQIRVKDEARSAKLRRIADARHSWEAVHKSIDTDRRRQAEIAAREELRRWYAAQVKPRLMELQPQVIARAIDVSRTYARQIVAGHIPHRAHFAALAELAGVPEPTGVRLASVPAQGTAASEPAVDS